jgi:O-antigen/teichoic acid export membrane protein
MLQPTEFALFSSIMALLMFLSSPMSAISMLIIRKVSALKAHNCLHLIRSLFFRINSVLLLFGVGVLILLIIFTPYLQHYLRVENFLPIFLFGLILIISIFNAVFIAFFQGLQRFFWLGIFGLLGVSGKIIISVGFIALGFGVEGPLLGVLSAMVLVFLLGTPLLFSSLPAQMPHRKLHFNLAIVKKAIPVLIATVTFAALTQLDMVIVNFYFQPEEAGLYAAASVLGKAVLYLPGGLILALFPMVSESHSKGLNSFGIFRQAVIVTVVLSGLIACIYFFLGDLIISVLYGPSYQGAGNILRWYGFAILPLTVVIITEQYLIAKGQVLFAWIFLLILPLQLMVIYIWHSELWMILLIMGIFGLLLAVIGYSLMWRASRLDICPDFQAGKI